MSENTFKVTLDETGQSMTRSIKIKPKKFFNSRWTTDKEGKEIAKKKMLGDTVYFHTDLEGYPEGATLDFKLFDYDDRLGVDMFKEDDYQFPKEEVHRRATIKKINGVKTASVELLLNKAWEDVLKEDTAYDIELYWEIHYKMPAGVVIRAQVPKDKKEFLEVELNDQLLFFSPAVSGGKLPQLIAKDGSPVFFAKLTDHIKGKLDDKLEAETTEKMKGVAKDKIKKGISDAIKKHNDNIEEQITNIALVKMAKGELKNVAGKPYPFTFNSYKKESIVDNLEGNTYGTIRGEQIQILRAKRINPLMTIDELDETLSSIFDLIKFSNMSIEEITSKPLSAPTALLTPFLPANPVLAIELWVEFLGMLALKQHEELEAHVDKEMSFKLEEAKKEGLDAVMDFIDTYNTDYELVEISNKTLSKLMIGEFKTLNEVEKFNKQVSADSNIGLLVREIKNDYSPDRAYVIESIHINE